MPYPREIYLDSDTEERLISYLEDELLNHYAERGPHLEDLMTWQKDYWAKPTKEKATFPFSGAATIVIPLNAISIEAIHARMMTTRFALADLVNAQPVSADWSHAAQPFEKFMNKELLENMKVRRTFGDCFLEATKYGSMIGKVSYERVTKNAVRSVNGLDEDFEVVVRDGAVFDAVPDARFLMPHGDQDPQKAAWCGEEHSESPYYVMTLEQGGLFRPGTIIDGPDWETDPDQVSKLHTWVNRIEAEIDGGQQGNRFDRNQEALEHTEAQWPKRIDWVEIWLAWDVDQSGKQKEIVVHYHRESRTIMSCRYNWYRDLRRPYRIGVYFPVEHRWRGVGICKMNEQFQREITTQHRQRLDNATLANMRMIKVSKLSGYGPKEPIFPGKMWFLDDMTHVDTLQLGEIYPSAYNNEQATLIYSQQRTGINEVNLGQPQVGTPGTATSDLARIQEGNKKFDFVYSNFNEFVNEIVLDTADVVQQFGPRRLAYFNTVENGQLVKQLFSVPETPIQEGLLISLKVTTQQQNKVIDRQNWVQIASLIQQYYDGALKLSQLAGNPDAMALIVNKGLGAVTEAMRQILESYDVRNIDRIIVPELEQMIRENGLAIPGINPGGNPGASFPGQAPGVVPNTQAFPTLGAAGNGILNRLQDIG